MKTFAPRAATMPAIVRSPMLPRAWSGFWNGMLRTAAPPATPEAAALAARPMAWEAAVRVRRRVLLALILVATAFAAMVLASSQRELAHPLLQGLQIALFALLFAWVAAGCFTALMGFFVLLRGDRHAISAADAGDAPLPADARTALVMPICHEDVATVFAGLRATAASLERSGALHAFDIFVLSDSKDETVLAEERAAFEDLRDALGERGRVFYRVRRVRTKKKAGNVSDFCRRWGRNYRYMVVMDADSVMSGDCLQTLVRLMEKHPNAGILQTAPQAVGHATLHARAQQFAARVTGQLFTVGMQFWQLGEAHYFGHNAIIRVRPFMDHCGLAPLEGRGAFSGHILSHDFVEAALMRRAGFHVWLVADLVGSYEQQPPHLLAELQRDRRWCQGNLQNARLIAEPGLHAVHRGMLATGAMSYVSAPLWLLYVVLGALLWLVGGNVLFTPEGTLAVGIPGLWAGTLTMLVLPRLLGVGAVFMRRETHRFGGGARLVQSAVLEAGLAMLLAPLRMVAHTLFVVGAMTGWKLEWKSPPREASDVSWAEAVQRFAPVSLVVASIAAAMSLAGSSAVLWMMPVGLPLVLAVPFTVLTGSTALGERVRRARLLLVPEEASSPTVLRQAWSFAKMSPAALRSLVAA
jgi:membrane glycosyltransferase